MAERYVSRDKEVVDTYRGLDNDRPETQVGVAATPEDAIKFATLLNQYDEGY